MVLPDVEHANEAYQCSLRSMTSRGQCPRGGGGGGGACECPRGGGGVVFQFPRRVDDVTRTMSKGVLVNVFPPPFRKSCIRTWVGGAPWVVLPRGPPWLSTPLPTGGNTDIIRPKCHMVIDGSGGYRGGGGRGDHPTPLVAENFVCSNSNFSPTGAITPPPPPPPPHPLVAITPPPFRKSCIRAWTAWAKWWSGVGL